MGRVEVQVRNRPKNPLEERTPNMAEALSQKYEIENFRDRKVALWTTNIGKKRNRQTGEVQDDALDALLKSHNVQTQGGIWREDPEKEQAFWYLVDFQRWAKAHMRPDNPILRYNMNKILTLYHARYNQSLSPDQTTVKTVVAMPPMLGVNPMGGSYAPEVMQIPAGSQQKKE